MFEERITSHGRFSILLLLLLLSAQFVIFSRGPWKEPSGDEKYYTSKADQLLKTGEIPKAEGSGDWRPAGYTFFIALPRLMTENWEAARILCALIQFTLLSLIIILFQTIVCLCLKSSRAVFLSAILLGIQPWVFEDSRNLIPDSLTASLTTIGLMGMFAARYVKGKLQTAVFFLSAIVLCSTIYLRPEMIVMAPLLILASLFSKKQEKAPVVRKLMIGLFILFLFLTLQLLYRARSTGKLEIYGNFSVQKRGAHSWTNSWFSTEQVAYTHFLHGNGLLTTTVDNFPDHAFADNWERDTVRKALTHARENQTYDGTVDALFQKVAEKRVHDNFFVNSVLTRVWRTFMMWFYFESDSPLSKWVKQPVLRNTIIFGFYFLKILIYSLAVCSAAFIIRSARNGTFAWYHYLTGLMLLCVTIRTLLMGVVLGWMIHRYALVAWPAMMWCALSGIIAIRNQEHLLKPILRKKEI